MAASLDFYKVINIIPIGGTTFPVNRGARSAAFDVHNKVGLIRSVSIVTIVAHFVGRISATCK